MALTSRGLLRLFLFLGGYITFLMLGATVFSTIEGPEELEKVKSLRKLRAEFLKSHPAVTGKDFIIIRVHLTKSRHENTYM